MPDVRKSEEEFAKDFKKEELERGDVPALIIAALVVFLPAALIVILLMVGIPYLFLGR